MCRISAGFDIASIIIDSAKFREVPEQLVRPVSHEVCDSSAAAEICLCQNPHFRHRLNISRRTLPCRQPVIEFRVILADSARLCVRIEFDSFLSIGFDPFLVEAGGIAHDVRQGDHIVLARFAVEGFPAAYLYILIAVVQIAAYIEGAEIFRRAACGRRHECNGVIRFFCQQGGFADQVQSDTDVFRVPFQPEWRFLRRYDPVCSVQRQPHHSCFDSREP